MEKKTSSTKTKCQRGEIVALMAGMTVVKMVLEHVCHKNLWRNRNED